ncbi:MAG: hypothetical protein ABGF52_03175 [Candidatus Asgardarchaeum sp.]
MVLTPFRVTPQAPHHSVLSHRNVLSVLYSHHIQTLPQYSQIFTKYLTVSEGVFLISVLVLANISTFSLTFFATSMINTYYTVMGDVYQWDVSSGFNKPINLTVLKSVYEIDGVEKLREGTVYQ